ncbi:hypothetical protein EUX98_g1844 [Antrodiella citrinella]|uniref:Uncharacterized protein n=1 Tax=Antrodiella citrinella TaxID=2447956 RepID=A0A4S4N0D7_9APHY|nr:hypothetical protein EUX98_g1844 [Antrodiella citrinella]
MSSDNSNAGYESISQDQQGMGGGAGTQGSGVAGGYEGSQNQAGGGAQMGNTQAGTGQKQDWLDKGITSVGKKLGFNVSESNADKAGDFMNKEAKQYGGHNLPGVQ